MLVAVRPRPRWAGRFAVCIVALVLAAACSSGPGSPGTASPDTSPGRGTAGATGPAPAAGGPAIPVLGTENFYADLLAQIGGSRVSVSSLLNSPNADPHAFEASPQAAVAVADARLVVVNGMGYDDFMRHLLSATPNANRVVITVQELLGLPSSANAHVWYDPATMPKVARAIAQALAQLEPANAAYFEARLSTCLASLQALDERVASLRTRYAGTPVAFTEPVAGYLAEAIGLSVLTPEGFAHAIEVGTDPAPADVAAERDLLTHHRVRVLLYNNQAVTPLTTQIRQLAVASGIPVVGVAETMPPGYADYRAWMLATLDELGAALAKGA